jgi:hypothetical protein
MNFDDNNNNYNKDIMLLLLSFWCAFHGRLINLKKIKNVLSVLSVAEAKSNIIKSSSYALIQYTSTTFVIQKWKRDRRWTTLNIYNMVYYANRVVFIYFIKIILKLYLKYSK